MGALTVTLKAGEPYQMGAGNYLRLRKTTFPLDIKYYRSGRELTAERAEGVEAGYSAAPELSGDRGPDGMSNDAFDSCVLQSARSQEIKLYVTAGKVDDDRTGGVIPVVDGSVEAVKAGTIFMGSVGQVPALGTYANCQLWNPAGSGEIIVVRGVTVSAKTDSRFAIAATFAALTNLDGNVPKPMNVGGIYDEELLPVCELRTGAGLYLIPDYNSYLVAWIRARETKTLLFDSPVILNPSNGIDVQSGEIDDEYHVSFKYEILAE